jgi:acyl carrier protein
LTAEPDVHQAIVIIREDVPGIKKLVAYVTAADSAEPDPTALKQQLRQRLPDYMVPTVIIVLDSLPLTPSGKVARRRLPAPPTGGDEQLWVAPRTPTEASLADIWQEVLGAERVGAEDDFFELGGHSLLATKVVARIRDRFQVSLPLKYVFRHPTPATLARALDTLLAAKASAPSADAGEREEFRL